MFIALLSLLTLFTFIAANQNEFITSLDWRWLTTQCSKWRAVAAQTARCRSKVLSIHSTFIILGHGKGSGTGTEDNSFVERSRIDHRPVAKTLVIVCKKVSKCTGAWIRRPEGWDNASSHSTWRRSHAFRHFSSFIVIGLHFGRNRKPKPVCIQYTIQAVHSRPNFSSIFNRFGDIDGREMSCLWQKKEKKIYFAKHSTTK